MGMAKCLTEACCMHFEREFYHTDGWTEHRADAQSARETLLVLSAEVMHQRVQERVDVKAQRELFGAIQLELQLEGSHLDMGLQCASGSNEAFNSMLEFFLELPER